MSDEGFGIERNEIGLVAVDALVVGGVQSAGFFWFYLEDILNSGRHLLRLINDVLDLAKVDAGKMELYPEKFSLGKAIEEVCSITKPIAQKKGVGLEVKLASELGYITLDKPKFKQVLYNLLSNAVKFTDDGGKVEIRAEMHDPHHFSWWSKTPASPELKKQGSKGVALGRCASVGSRRTSAILRWREYSVRSGL